MTEVVLATENEFQKAGKIFADAPEVRIEMAPKQEDLLAKQVAATGARAVIVGIERYTGPLYDALAVNAAGRGALIARFGVGHDGIDKSIAREKGILVTNTPGALDVSVAEHAMWLMGNLARKISALEARFRSGHFEPSPGRELHGRALAVVGFGAIGRRVAMAAHFGFGMTVVAVGSRHAAELEIAEGEPLAELLPTLGVRAYTNDLDLALRHADVVSLHMPSNSKTRHLINRTELESMKPEALLINTARGAVVDEIALFDALAGGQIGGAALDVFETEPYQPAAPGKDFRTLSNVVLTPHVGSNTREANSRMAHSCLDTVVKFVGGHIDALPRVDLPVP